MQVIVLGAGVVGVTSAWFLTQAGHQVTVIDRQPGAALETSFANGGQISVSHAEPWANPGVLPKALKWLGQEDAPLLLRWQRDPALWRWLLQFLCQCPPGATRRNIRRIVGLALYSRQQLQALRAACGIDYAHRERGILHLYTDPAEYARAQVAAQIISALGCERRVVDVAECLRIEPALTAAAPLLVGGDYTAGDESGDAHRFTTALAQQCAAAGVRFAYSTPIDRLCAAGDRLEGVQCGAQRFRADAYVLALGSYSPLLCAPLGLRLPVVPAKGYSATLQLGADSTAPEVSLTDDERKIVISRLGQRLRIAGTAEFCGYDLSLNPVRCQALTRRAAQLFPQLNPVGEPEYWCGLRPATPGNVPLLGPTRYRNLWLNTGHGTLGWTLSCGSAAVLAAQISGQPLPDGVW